MTDWDLNALMSSGSGSDGYRRTTDYEQRDPRFIDRAIGEIVSRHQNPNLDISTMHINHYSVLDNLRRSYPHLVWRHESGGPGHHEWIGVDRAEPYPLVAIPAIELTAHPDGSAWLKVGDDARTFRDVSGALMNLPTIDRSIAPDHG